MAIQKLSNSEEVKNYYLNTAQNEIELKKFNCDFSQLDKIIATKKTTQEKIDAIYKFVQKNLKFVGSLEFSNQYKFKRSAAEVFNDKKASGCTDYAMVFSVLARKYGIPTTLLSTASKSTTDKILDAENEKDPEKQAKKYANIRKFSGHSFCECFDKEKGDWILADPRLAKTEKNYQVDGQIKLTGLHFVGGEKTFNAYSRGIDYNKSMTINEFNNYAVNSLTGKTSGNYEEDFKNSAGLVEKVKKEEINIIRKENGEPSDKKQQPIISDYKKSKEIENSKENNERGLSK